MSVKRVCADLHVAGGAVVIVVVVVVVGKVNQANGFLVWPSVILRALRQFLPGLSGSAAYHTLHTLACAAEENDHPIVQLSIVKVGEN